MLIREVTSAKDQLDLFRTIIDSTWSAISAEAAAEEVAKKKCAAAAASKPKPRKAPKPNLAATPTAPIKKQPTKSQVPKEQNAAQSNTQATQNQPQVPQPRRVHPTPTQASTTTPNVEPTATMPVARLGKVDTVPTAQWYLLFKTTSIDRSFESYATDTLLLVFGPQQFVVESCF